MLSDRKRSAFLVLSLVFANGCGGKLNLGGNPKDKTETKVVRLAVTEAKLISPSIANPVAPGSLTATTYRISVTDRLLLRQPSLSTEAEKILPEQPLLLRVEAFAKGLDLAKARANLRLCPLTSDWMTAATWKRAHPYSGGSWKAEGGDFDPSACISPLDSKHAALQGPEEAQFCGVEQALCFELSNWMQVYVRERGQNFGFMLLMDHVDDTFDIWGDQSIHGPTVFWRVMR